MTQFSLTDPIVVLSLLAPFLFIIVVRYATRNKQLTKKFQVFARQYPILWGFTIIAIALGFLFIMVNALSIIFWNWR